MKSLLCLVVLIMSSSSFAYTYMGCLDLPGGSTVLVKSYISDRTGLTFGSEVVNEFDDKEHCLKQQGLDSVEEVENHLSSNITTLRQCLKSSTYNNSYKLADVIYDMDKGTAVELNVLSEFIDEESCNSYLD